MSSSSAVVVVVVVEAILAFVSINALSPVNINDQSSFSVSKFRPSSSLPLPGNGVVDPGLHYQRYRLSEYSKTTPYYQWWYFYVGDMESKRHFAWSYGMTTCNGAPNCEYDMGTVGIILLDDSQNSQKTPKLNLHSAKVEAFPLTHWEVSEDFHVKIYSTSAVEAKAAGLSPLHELNPLGDNLFLLRGNMMLNSSFSWMASGLGLNSSISWNITLERIYGYYAQDTFEKADEWLKGVIMWDTYAHNCLVRNGVVNVDKQIYRMDHDEDPSGIRFRGYGDENWGEIFPMGPATKPEDLSYAWGWYLSHIPNKNVSQDVSIIAGVGKTETGFPLYTMEGYFADVRLNSSHRIEFRVMKVYDQQFTSCSDGSFKRFDVERSNWTSYSDPFGNASFPLNQLVTLESENYLITQDCRSNIEDYNRLMFMFKSGAFSDFEGLGVQCQVKVTYKPTNQVLIDQMVLSGIEYGFNYNTTNIPPLPWKK